MYEILKAVAVLFGAGLLAAVLLAITSHFFGQKSEEKLANIRNCLPGANCGACGFAGCDSYAEALAKGEAAANLCIPGGGTAAAEIAKLIGGEAGEVDKRVAFVHCGGTVHATEKVAEFVGMNTCRGKNLTFGGDGVCKFGCLGCGDCADVCPVEAIEVKDGIARVKRDECIGCGRCVTECPKHIISLIPLDAKAAVACSNKQKGAAVRKLCKVGCIACRKCEKSCEYGAIKVIDDLAVIDYEKCVSCGKCIEVCPVGCIVEASAACKGCSCGGDN